MPLVDLVLVVLFSTWFILTAIGQLDTSAAQRIRDWDVCMLVPSFKFFAPTPSVHDLHLLYRDRLPDGTVSRWHEVPMAKPPRVISPIWNPGRRYNKALFDTTQHLARHINENKLAPQAVMLSIPYLALLNFISALPRPYFITTTQFLVMRSDRARGGEPQQFFLSSVHAVNATT